MAERGVRAARPSGLLLATAWVVAATVLASLHALTGLTDGSYRLAHPRAGEASRERAESGAAAARRERRRPDRRRQAGRRALALAARARRAGHSLPLAPVAAPPYELDDRHHDYPALDIETKPGREVYAVTTGRVTDRTLAGACGKGLIIKGTDELTYTYCHASKLLVRKGVRVPAGRPIMKAGNTGNSSGPHLHLQVESKWGKLVCPQHLMKAWANGRRLKHADIGRRACVRR